MDELQLQRQQRTTPRTRKSRDEQAHDSARAARRRAEKRRAEQSGLSGWVAERASQWTLDGPDWSFFEQQKYFWNPLMDYWFRMELEGWEKLPEPPALLIGIHSGGPFPWDAWTVGVQWWRYFGRTRPLHGTAHDALMATPVVGAYFRRMGVIPAAADRPACRPADQACRSGLLIRIAVPGSYLRRLIRGPAQDDGTANTTMLSL